MTEIIAIARSKTGEQTDERRLADAEKAIGAALLLLAGERTR